MKNYLDKEDKYNQEFADVMVKEFLRLKYGISNCFPEKNIDLVTMRKELVDWQSNADYTPLSAVRSNYKKWLPINFCQEQDVCYVNINVNSPEAVSKSYRVNPPQLIWTFTHNLGFFPNVTTTDDANQEIVGTVTYIDVNSLKVEFSSPVSGWAYLS
jgi:hypothetical protein